MVVHRKELDVKLRALCVRLGEKGMTTNCELGKYVIVFFGLKFSASGVALNDDKVIALAGIPINASELHSFLGLVVYCSTYILDLDTITRCGRQQQPPNMSGQRCTTRR